MKKLILLMRRTDDQSPGKNKHLFPEDVRRLTEDFLERKEVQEIAGGVK